MNKTYQIKLEMLEIFNKKQSNVRELLVVEYNRVLEKKWGTKYQALTLSPDQRKHQALTLSSKKKHQALTLSPKGRKRTKKYKKWRRKEKEGFYSNFKHSKAAVFNNGFFINDKAVVKDKSF